MKMKEEKENSKKREGTWPGGSYISPDEHTELLGVHCQQKTENTALSLDIH